MFKDNGTFVNFYRFDGTLLHHVNDIDGIRFLLKWGAVTTIYDDVGRLPIHRAIQRANLEVFNELLVHPNGTTKTGGTLLHVACRCDIIIVQKLIQSGVDLNATDDYGNTALHFARYDCMMELLKAKADPNIVNRWGQTPLHLAIKAGSFDCVKALLSAGAHFWVPNDNRTPYELAIPNSDIAEYLKAYEDGMTSVKGAID
jgi:ankyrin repeat protein